jgi:hypothetical protein
LFFSPDPAFPAAARFVGQTFLGVKGLFPGAKDKISPAFLAFEYPVFMKHERFSSFFVVCWLKGPNKTFLLLELLNYTR